MMADNTFVLLAITFSNALAFASNLLMARLLNISDYGVYVSCSALFSFVSILVSTVQTTSARLAAEQAEARGEAEVWGIFRHSLVTLSVFDLFLFIVVLPFAWLLAGFLRVEVNLIIFLILGLLVLAPFGVTTGYLQGLQRFRLFGLALIFVPLSRLLGSLLFIGLGEGLPGVVLSIPLGLAMGFILNSGMLRRVYSESLTRKNLALVKPASRRESFSHVVSNYFLSGWPTLAGTIGFTFMTTLDVVLIQHLFGGVPAGNYAAIATLGKTIIFLTGSFALLIVPKAAQAVTRGENASHLLRRALAGTLGLGLLGLAGLYLLGPVLIKLFITNFPDELDWLIVLHGGAMMLYSFSSIWVAFFIAVKQPLYLLLVVPVLVLQITLIYMWHSSLTQVIGLLYLGGIILYALGEMCLWLYNSSHRAKPFLSNQPD